MQHSASASTNLQQMHMPTAPCEYLGTFHMPAYALQADMLDNIEMDDAVGMAQCSSQTAK